MANTISLIHVEVPMTEPFKISSGSVNCKPSILIRLELEGVIAWGEASPMPGGFYSSETPDSCWMWLTEHAIPILLRDACFDARKLADHAELAGDPFSIAGLDGALWDLEVQRLSSSFIQRVGAELNPIASGLAVGIYPTIDELIAACERYLSDGYRRLKIKIQPGWDWEPLKAVRETLGTIPLMADANAAYSTDDIPHLARLDEFGLMMIEQPFPAADLYTHRLLQQRINTPICIDESAATLDAVREAVDLEACRIVNLKIQRIGRFSQAVAMHDLCRRMDIPVWVGTMPELGIGAVHALYLALLPNCTYPTDVEASSRWFIEDIIDPPIEVRDGWIDLPVQHESHPNVSEDTVELYTVDKMVFPF